MEGDEEPDDPGPVETPLALNLKHVHNTEERTREGCWDILSGTQHVELVTGRSSLVTGCFSGVQIQDLSG